MNSNLLISVLVFGASFSASWLFVGVVRKVAHRFGFVSRPSADRWNSRAVALGGGIGIHLAIIICLLVLGDRALLVGVFPAYLLIFILGLVDDIWGVSPSGKLIGQAIAAAYVASQGFLLPMPWAIFAIAVSVIWIMGSSNALNLIDNMDGLAAGCSAIAALGLWWILGKGAETQQPLALAALATAGSSLGFLVHNFYPAKVFMGDAGSLGLGFLLAVLSSQVRIEQSQIPPFLSFFAVVLLLVVPVFDTVLVMISRTSAKRPITTGGRDHSSHRLVALGLKERSAVLVLYGLGLMGLAASYLVIRSTPSEFAIIVITAFIGLSLLALFLLDMVVYPTESQAPGGFRKHAALPTPILYVMEVALDICVISLAWTLAHWFRFQDSGSYTPYYQLSLVPWLPFVLACKLVACLALRLYRGLWKSISAPDVYRIFKAAALGSGLVVVGLSFVTRLQDLSRLVILLDGLMTFMGLVAARAGLIALKRWFRKLAAIPKRAALIGPESLKPLVTQAAEEEGGTEFVGVISTDANPSLENGAVLGAAVAMEEIIQREQISILYVATEKYAEMIEIARRKGVTLRQVKLQIV